MADDGNLSMFGYHQAERLIDNLEPKGVLPEPTILLASPRRRARQTLHPVAHHLSLPVVVTKALDERSTIEPMPKFRKRIQEWMELMARELAPDDVVWACSHMDWLEEALILLPGDLDELERSSGFSPAESLSFEIRPDGLWRSLHRLQIS